MICLIAFLDQLTLGNPFLCVFCFGQEMQKELLTWKANIEQQLAGISVTFNRMHLKLIPKVGKEDRT